MSVDIWNPWHGCTKCSPGCEHCYMYALDAYRGRPEWSDKVFKTNQFKYPLKKTRDGAFKLAPGWRVRTNMTSDTFHPDARPWLPAFWEIIKARPDLTFWLLTKRPENIMASLPPDWDGGYPNVVLAVTVENQDMFDKHWPVFEQVPAARKELCCAPLLSAIDIAPALRSNQISTIMAGGENYDDPRPCDLAWAFDLSRQAREHRVPFCFYESGTKPYLNGFKAFLPRKADQSALAYLLGVNYVPDPAPDFSKTYNLNHCAFCANRMLCNGCMASHGCRNCCTVPAPGGLMDVWAREDWLLANTPPAVSCLLKYFKERG